MMTHLQRKRFERCVEKANTLKSGGTFGFAIKGTKEWALFKLDVVKDLLLEEDPSGDSLLNEWEDILELPKYVPEKKAKRKAIKPLPAKKITNKIPKQRQIYSNYNVWEIYSDKEIKANLLDEGYEEDEITDELISDRRDLYAQEDWEREKENLEELFDEEKEFIFLGEVGRWNGVRKVGRIFSTLQELLNTAAADCEYIHFYDENGHLYLTCSHHDGTCHYEIKEVTEKGQEYYDNWNYGREDGRTEEYVHTQIFRRYSRLPNFAHRFYGCKRYEYEPVTKERLLDELNNKAKSFYR